MFYITLGTIFKGLPFARSPVSDLFIALYWSFLTSPLGHVKPIRSGHVGLFLRLRYSTKKCSKKILLLLFRLYWIKIAISVMCSKFQEA